MDWNWSFHGFRVFGVDVRIHWSLPAFFLYYVLRGFELGMSLTTLGLFVVLPMLLLFASVVAHELGHVFAARHFRLRVDHMILTPIGGMVMVAQGRTPTHELVVAAAGPLVNLALAVIGGALYLALGGPLSAGLLLPVLGDATFVELYRGGHLASLVLFDFVQSQMTLFLFNVLLAAYPMDGGRVLMSLLWRRRGFHAALIASCKVARVIAVLIGLGGIALARPGLAFIAIFVYIQAQSTLARAPMLPDPGYGYDPRFAAARHPQDRQRRGDQQRGSGPSFLRRWWLERRELKLRRLLAQAETKGIASLSPSDRAWLKKVREQRRS